MKTLRELFERETGCRKIPTHEPNKWYYYVEQPLIETRSLTEGQYYKAYSEWIEKGVAKQYAIRDKLIKELMNENKELRDIVTDPMSVIEKRFFEEANKKWDEILKQIWEL